MGCQCETCLDGRGAVDASEKVNWITGVFGAEFDWANAGAVDTNRIPIINLGMITLRLPIIVVAALLSERCKRSNQRFFFSRRGLPNRQSLPSLGS